VKRTSTEHQTEVSDCVILARSAMRVLPSPSPRPSPLGRGRQLPTLHDGFVASVSVRRRWSGCVGMLVCDEYPSLTTARQGKYLFQNARTLSPLPGGEGQGEGERRADISSTSLISLALARNHGGAATPPYQVLVGRTCRYAVEFRIQVRRRLRPRAPVEAITFPHF
jgi:hypothetical protein